jgi:hypothetical protein
VTKPLTIQSVNGSTVTVIQGYQVPGTTNGSAAVRCVYLTNNATLIGFTLTNGATRQLFAGDIIHEQSGAGVWCESTNVVVSNCVVVANVAPADGGGAYLGTLNNCRLISNQNSWSGGGGGAAYGSILNNCILTGNVGSSGGAAFQGTLNSCSISNNSAFSGGGAYGSTLNYCTIKGNSASAPGGGQGGGVSSSTLFNCMITNNTAAHGGGAYAGTLSNCFVIGNLATNGMGGGAYNSTLNNCLIQANMATNASATGTGGGIYYGTVNNCTIVGNMANNGGGVEAGAYNLKLKNCIVYSNTAVTGSNPNYHYTYINSSLFNSCCTTPLPTAGIANFTNAPLFVDVAGGDYHLQSNSPCINAGNNSFVIGTNDLDGNPRIAGGTVDMGAYEYQTPSSLLSYAWAQQYGLPTDGTADTIDSDGDGMNNWQEWIAGTIPTNAASVLQLSSPSNSLSGMKVTWQSVSGVTYYLQRGTNLAAQPAFSSIQSNIVGLTNTTSFWDTTATNGNSFFYRVGVQ